MAIKLTPKQWAVLEDALDEPHETVREAAEAVFAAAVGLIEDRAKFMVVGQLASAGPGAVVPADADYDHRMLLGWFSTGADAKSAANSLVRSAGSPESFRVAVMPCFHGTAAAYYQGRRAEAKAEAIASQSYLKRRLQERLDWLAEHPEARDTDPDWPEFMRGVIPMEDPAITGRRTA